MSSLSMAVAAILALGTFVFHAAGEPKQSGPSASKASPDTQLAGKEWKSLFDGKTLGHWKPTDFGGQGEVKIEKGEMILARGDSLTGVTWLGALPAKMNYEIDLDAKRVDGTDFFCGLTFPVNNTCASLILGGWGGSVCGISSLDGDDAANNQTTKIEKFENGTWYHIRMRVLPDKLQAWVDDEQIVDISTKGRKISVRAEVEPSQPMGIATYQTTGAIKNIRIRKIEK